MIIKTFRRKHYTSTSVKYVPYNTKYYILDKVSPKKVQLMVHLCCPLWVKPVSVIFQFLKLTLTHCAQASELRAYIKSKGADISEENSEGGLHVDLAQIIEACDVCLKDDDKGW